MTRAVRLITPPTTQPDDPGADLRAALVRHDVASRALLFWALSGAAGCMALVCLAAWVLSR